MKMGDSNFITSSELAEMRKRESPINAGDSMFVYDRLEEQGILQIHEYIGGCLYLEPNILEEVPLVAGVSIKRSGKSLKIDKAFHEHGHGELTPLLVKQVEHFAEFYGYGMEPLNLCGEGNHNIMNDSLI